MTIGPKVPSYAVLRVSMVSIVALVFIGVLALICSLEPAPCAPKAGDSAENVIANCGPPSRWIHTLDGTRELDYAQGTIVIGQYGVISSWVSPEETGDSLAETIEQTIYGALGGLLIAGLVLLAAYATTRVILRLIKAVRACYHKCLIEFNKYFVLSLVLLSSTLQGCTYMRAEVEHVSHPLAGYPLSDKRSEDALNQASACLGSKSRHAKVELYVEQCLGYKFTESGFYGPDLTYTGRFGVEFDFGSRN